MLRRPPALALTVAGSALLAAALGAPSVAARGAAPRPAPAKAAAPAKKSGPVGYSHVWHAVKPGEAAPLDENGRPMLVLQALNIPDRVALTATSERGGFSAMDLDRAAHVLRDPRTGNEHPIDPRALDLVYRVACHFGTPEVRIISGYRTPRANSHSNHGRGRAIDLVFPGTTDEEVARFARELGFVGVGVYPVSGFVHLDVRERSYFWVDSSAPGKKNRERGILGDLATKSDARALARGERAVPPFGVTSDVEAALASAKPTAGPASVEDEDVDD